MLTAIIPRAMPWARSFCPFRACYFTELLPFQGVLLLELLGLQPVLKPHAKVQYLIIYRSSVPFQNPIFVAKLVKVSQKVVFLSLF